MGIYEALEASPSQKRNYYISTILLTIITFVVSTILSISLTWTLFSSVDWASFNHNDYLKSCGFSFIEQHHYRCQNYLSVILSDASTKQYLILHTLFVLLISTTTSMITFFSLWKKEGTDLLRHIEGPQLYDSDKALIEVRKNSKKERLEESIGSGIKIHPKLHFSEKRLHQNIFVLGMPGSGKTLLITPIINQAAIVRKDKCIIYDEKKELTGLFYNRKTTLLLAPFDLRSVQWNISADVTTLSQAESIAKSMIPVNEKDPIWGQASRLIFVGAMMYCIKKHGTQWGWKELYIFISSDESAMAEALQQAHPAAGKLIVEGSKTTQSLLINLTTSLSWLKTLSTAWSTSYVGHNTFSIRTFIRERTDKNILIIQNDPEYSSVSEPLINAIITLATNNLLSLENSQTRKVWLFVDELGNLKKNPSILKWLSLARSKGGIMVAGTQSLSMLHEIFGKNVTDSISSMVSTLIALRVSGTGDTARYISDSFGKRRIERPQAQANGKISWHPEDLPVVPISAITNLPQVSKSKGINGFLSVAGWRNVYKLNWALKIFPKIAEESIPADWTKSIEFYPEEINIHEENKHLKPSPKIDKHTSQHSKKKPLPTASNIKNTESKPSSDISIKNRAIYFLKDLVKQPTNKIELSNEKTIANKNRLKNKRTDSEIKP